jgi:hypothetical protein
VSTGDEPVIVAGDFTTGEMLQPVLVTVTVLTHGGSILETPQDADIKNF